MGRNLQVHLNNKATELVHSAGRRPVLHHYINDGTSYLTRYEIKMSAEGAASVDTLRRRQRKTSSFLCERSFYITLDADGTARAAVVIYMPRMLSTGTTAWHCYNASTQAHQLLKEMGHQGISIAHYCYDRAKYTAILALQEARHNQWAAEHLRQGGHAMQPLLDWVVGTGCAMHDASKALEWSLNLM